MKINSITELKEFTETSSGQSRDEKRQLSTLEDQRCHGSILPGLGESTSLLG